jgi:acetyl-CoA acetyltransferase
MSDKAVAIVGAAETDRLGKIPDQSAIGLAVEASLRALADCGLSVKAIDGVATTSQTAIDLNPAELAFQLGIQPRWMDGTNNGGCSYLEHVRHAVAALLAGQASTILIAHGESGRSGIGNPPYVMPIQSPRSQFEAPFGITHPPTMFTIPVLRFMKETGLTHEQLAAVPVVQRKWAAKVPRAKLRDPISVADVFASPEIAYPFHLLHCCLVTDGGGALVLTLDDRAHHLRQIPVYVRGTGESAESTIISQMNDFTTSGAFSRSGADALAEAQVSTSDIDHLMVYDAFAHLPIYGLEDLGFVKRGEAGAFIAEGNTSPGGSLPMNTNGGGLCYTHTGMYGMFAILESVRQLRGEAAHQVRGVETSMVLGVGAMFMAAGALVLGRSQK